jgi:hypothetical protein
MHEALIPLQTEIMTFEEQLPILRTKHPIGTYVLVTGDCLVGGFTTYSAALEAGYEKVGMKPFLVKQVSNAGEEVQHVYGIHFHCLHCSVN